MEEIERVAETKNHLQKTPISGKVVSMKDVD